ncbi:MAG: hypothetical protein ABI651_13145, partial [Verrucomicrobiota bacterium]
LCRRKTAFKSKTGFLGQKITVGTRGIFGFSTIVGLLWNKSAMVCTIAMTENDWAFNSKNKPTILPKKLENLVRKIA